MALSRIGTTSSKNNPYVAQGSARELHSHFHESAKPYRKYSNLNSLFPFCWSSRTNSDQFKLSIVYNNLYVVQVIFNLGTRAFIGWKVWKTKNLFSFLYFLESFWLFWVNVNSYWSPGWGGWRINVIQYSFSSSIRPNDYLNSVIGSW